MVTSTLLLSLAGLLLVGSWSVAAQDPAPSWLAYVKAAGGGSRVLRVNASWEIPPAPEDGGGTPAFWFGIEPNPAMLLVQPISAKWEYGTYTAFNEVFSWFDGNDVQGNNQAVSPGTKGWATITYQPNNGSYGLEMHMDGAYDQYMEVSPAEFSAPADTVLTDVYFVVEHQVDNCAQLPSSGRFQFTDISIRWEDHTHQLVWQPVKFRPQCSIVPSALGHNAVQFTWNTNANAALE